LFFPWYNEEHHHSGIAMLTPETVHTGRVDAVLTARQRALDAAYAAHPERFVRGPPKVARPPAEVWINRPAQELELDVPPKACAVGGGAPMHNASRRHGALLAGHPWGAGRRAGGATEVGQWGRYPPLGRAIRARHRR